MDFNLFMYCTIGRRAELEAGMTGTKPELYQRMLSEIAEYATYADQAGYSGFGHPEHHLQIEGFEIANDPLLMSMWLGKHTERLRVITCGFVSTAHNPLRTAESIATMDHMLGGRFGVGIVRGYQARWVDNFRIRPDLQAVGPWNKNSEQDTLNREYFEEFVEIVVKALTHETFSHQGKFWTFPPEGFVNSHPQLGLPRLWPGCCSRYACQRGWHRSTAAAVAASTALRRIHRVDDDGEILGAVCRAADRPRRRPRFLQNHLVCLSRRSRQTQPQHRPW